MNISFRQMRPEDAEAVERVEIACFAMPWSRKAFWREASQSDAYYLLAEENQTIIGYVGVWLLGTEGHITNVAVRPESRRYGVATAMLQELISLVKKRGITAMTLEARASNVAALSLYAKLGFHSVGQRPHYYQDNGEAAEILWNTHL